MTLRQLKFNYDMKKTIIISLQLSIMEAIIKPLSKEVTVMTMHGDLKDMVGHSTAKQVMWSSAFSW